MRRDFTLRDPKLFGHRPSSADSNSTERTPLLPNGANKPVPHSRVGAALDQSKKWILTAWTFATSENGHDIFKCSVAYLLASLATFFPRAARVLGTNQDSSQLVASVVVWFDPARTLGSMDQAVLLALLSFIYSAFIGYACMGVAAFFESKNLISVGHAIVLFFGIGCGLGLISWLKHYINQPLFNISTSVASMAIVAILTKEGAVQSGDFSHARTSQILQMVCVGIVISFVINMFVWPKVAHSRIRKDISNATDAIGVLLTAITSSFLSGLEDDINHPAATAASDELKKAIAAFSKNLGEAKYEHYILGTERQYHIDERLLTCIQQLSQDIGGLRSSAALQFELLKKNQSVAPNNAIEPTTGDSALRKPEPSQAAQADRNRRMSELSSRASTLDSASYVEEDESNARMLSRAAEGTLTASPAQIFETFISYLGPPMVRLTCSNSRYVLMPRRSHSHTHLRRC